MRGMDQLIALRQRRSAPSMVFVDCDPSGACAEWVNRTETGANFQVWIEPEDNPARLDFRPLTALRILVTGHQAQRVRSVAEVISKADPAAVYVAFLANERPVPHPFFKTKTHGEMAA